MTYSPMESAAYKRIADRHTISDPTQRTWTVSSTELEAIQSRLTTHNALATAVGFNGHVDITVSATEDQNVHKVALSGTPMLYGDWAVLAHIALAELGFGYCGVREPAHDANGAELDLDARPAGRCDHCGNIERWRHKTFLLRNQNTGEILQVGNSCIPDVTGYTGPRKWISAHLLAEDIDQIIITSTLLGRGITS